MDACEVARALVGVELFGRGRDELTRGGGAQFIDPARPLWVQLLVLWATTSSVDLVVMHGYAWMASRLQRWLRTVRAQRVQNRVLGGVLMGMGVSLVGVSHG